MYNLQYLIVKITISQKMRTRYDHDYISILAGGVCPIGCKFCVGNSIRKKEKPHFASMEKIKIFLELFKDRTRSLSISGSTSDPLFVDNFQEVVEIAKKDFKIALHTCAKDKLRYINTKSFYRICISLHEYPDEKTIDFIKKNKSKVRISTVYHNGNKKILDDLSFFDKVPAISFTIRKNIFNPVTPKFIKKLKRTGRKIFNQQEYIYKDKKIVVWDFADANKYINARYLWPDGNIRRQCYWYNLHKI